MSRNGSWTVFEPKMYRISQLEQENGYLFEQNMMIQNTLQAWMEDHKRITEENKELQRELQIREDQKRSMMESSSTWMKRMIEKQEQQEEV